MWIGRGSYRRAPSGSGALEQASEGERGAEQDQYGARGPAEHPGRPARRRELVTVDHQDQEPVRGRSDAGPDPAEPPGLWPRGRRRSGGRRSVPAARPAPRRRRSPGRRRAIPPTAAMRPTAITAAMAKGRNRVRDISDSHRIFGALRSDIDGHAGQHGAATEPAMAPQVCHGPDHLVAVLAAERRGIGGQQQPDGERPSAGRLRSRRPPRPRPRRRASAADSSRRSLACSAAPTRRPRR